MVGGSGLSFVNLRFCNKEESETKMGACLDRQLRDLVEILGLVDGVRVETGVRIGVRVELEVRV